MADRTEKIREFVKRARLMLDSLEQCVPIFTQLDQMTTMGSEVTKIKDHITNIKSDIISLKLDLEKTNKIIDDIKADAKQSQENVEKRQYNSFNCCTPEAKINWITIFGKVKPDLPSTMQDLIELLQTKLVPILTYYNMLILVLVLLIPDVELKKNKEEIAKFMGVRTLMPL
ncbi:unnamed protein product [Brachionus calyciflorus]|uniref:Uncharacterized protein n=1 Tax=Brachionus calyciflorus TaxID=104777 RepID=A0A814KGJ5_9BILA|nr:unnamed protein product [Brachionus calyciflorus]